MPPVVYTAVRRLDLSSGADWSHFVAYSGLAHLREVVSLDDVLCPALLRELTGEDWAHNVHEDFKIFLFRDLDYLVKRVAGRDANVLAVVGEPSAEDVATFVDPRFIFCGFDLVDEQGGISALTNCGGFDKAFDARELSDCGLLVDHARAMAVRARLRAEYPDELHAHCRVWAIWKMSTPTEA